MSNDIPIIYELDGFSPFKKKIVNPNYEKSNIKLPFRMLVSGGSAISMKTNGVLVFLSEFFQNTFDKIFICVKQNEKIYEWFTSLLPPGSWQIYEDEVPDIKSFEGKKEYENMQLLFLYDDMMNSKDHNKRILEWMLRGRKIGQNSSFIYITQSFTGMGHIGRSLRQQMTLFMLKKSNNMSAIEQIASEFRFGNKSKQDLINMYNYANDKPQNWLLINIEADDQKKIFRKNLNEYLN